MTDHFWVGGGSSTNWNATVPTNWSLTSGGVGGATAPVAGDRVFFDLNSGTGTSVWNTTISLATLDCTGSKNIVSHTTGAFTISSGNLVLPTGVGGTYTATGTSATFTFTATTGTQQIRTNGGKPGGMIFNGIGGTFQLQDNLALFVATTTLLNLVNGTFDAQTFTVNTPTFQGTSANTPVLKGSGAWTIGTGNAPGNVWLAGTLDISNFTSNINAVGTVVASGGRTFIGGSKVYQGTLSIAANTGGTIFTITGTNTFNALAVAGPNIMAMPTVTTTLIVAPTINATSGSEIAFIPSTVGSKSTISVASGAATFTWCIFEYMTFSGGATFVATNSFGAQWNNSGITITGPIPAGTGIGATRIRSGM